MSKLTDEEHSAWMRLDAWQRHELNTMSQVDLRIVLDGITRLTAKPAEIDALKTALEKFYDEEMDHAMTGEEFADNIVKAIPGLRGQS